jgi:hypothetical protein
VSYRPWNHEAGTDHDREIEQLRAHHDQRQLHTPSHYQPQTFNPLTPVVEEGEESGYDDSGPHSNQRVGSRLAGQHRSAQSALIGQSLADKYSRLAGAADQFSTPRQLPTRLTLPATDRPSTTEPSHDSRTSRSGPSRVSLESVESHPVYHGSTNLTR